MKVNKSTVKHILEVFAGTASVAAAFQRIGNFMIGLFEDDINRRKFLRLLFPNATLHGCVRNIKREHLEGLACLICGIPCQGESQAGLRQGNKHPETGLWRFVLQALQAIKDKKQLPEHVVIENVEGSTMSKNGEEPMLLRWAEDLIAVGYKGVAWIRMYGPTYGVGEERERVFLVASLHSRERAEAALFDGNRKVCVGDLCGGNCWWCQSQNGKWEMYNGRAPAIFDKGEGRTLRSLDSLPLAPTARGNLDLICFSDGTYGMLSIEALEALHGMEEGSTAILETRKARVAAINDSIPPPFATEIAERILNADSTAPHGMVANRKILYDERKSLKDPSGRKLNILGPNAGSMDDQRNIYHYSLEQVPLHHYVGKSVFNLEKLLQRFPVDRSSVAEWALETWLWRLKFNGNNVLQLQPILQRANADSDSVKQILNVDHKLFNWISFLGQLCICKQHHKNPVAKLAFVVDCVGLMKTFHVNIPNKPTARSGKVLIALLPFFEWRTSPLKLQIKEVDASLINKISTGDAGEACKQLFSDSTLVLPADAAALEKILRQAVALWNRHETGDGTAELRALLGAALATIFLNLPACGECDSCTGKGSSSVCSRLKAAAAAAQGHLGAEVAMLGQKAAGVELEVLMTVADGKYGWEKAEVLSDEYNSNTISHKLSFIENEALTDREVCLWRHSSIVRKVKMPTKKRKTV